MQKNKKHHLKEVPLEGSTDSNVRITVQDDLYRRFIETCQPHKCPFESKLAVCKKIFWMSIYFITTDLTKLRRQHTK